MSDELNVRVHVVVVVEGVSGAGRSMQALKPSARIESDTIVEHVDERGLAQVRAEITSLTRTIVDAVVELHAKRHRLRPRPQKSAARRSQ